MTHGRHGSHGICRPGNIDARSSAGMIRAVRGGEDAWLERVFPDGVRNCASSAAPPGIFCERAHRLYFLFLICLVILMVILMAAVVLPILLPRSFYPIASNFQPFTC